jgi:hypothetical protein
MGEEPGEGELAACLRSFTAGTDFLVRIRPNANDLRKHGRLSTTAFWESIGRAVSAKKARRLKKPILTVGFSRF